MQAVDLVGGDHPDGFAKALSQFTGRILGLQRRVGRHQLNGPCLMAGDDLGSVSRWRDFHQLDPDPGRAGPQDPQLVRRAVGEIQDAVTVERAAVIDPDYDSLAILQIGDFQIGRQRQVLVCGRDIFLVIEFAIGGVETMKAGSIPGAVPSSW